MKRILLGAAFAGGLALVGCTTGPAQSLAPLFVADAQTANALATAAGLPGDAQCLAVYQSIASVIAGPPGGPAPTVGPVTLAELGRSIQATMGGPTCAPITTQILAALLLVAPKAGALAGQFVPGLL